MGKITVDGVEVFSIQKVALVLDVSVNTLKRWYKWFEDDTYEKPKELKLPHCYYLDSKGTRYIKIQDIALLEDFGNKIQNEYKGVMAEFNSKYQWGKRGVEINNRKEEKNEQKKP